MTGGSPGRVESHPVEKGLDESSPGVIGIEHSAAVVDLVSLDRITSPRACVQGLAFGFAEGHGDRQECKSEHRSATRFHGIGDRPCEHLIAAADPEDWPTTALTGRESLGDPTTMQPVEIDH